ncbi:MAG: trypsin-like peptidase domain-containing protein [Gracilimonas sp.]|uniref:trypsin-like peptidase domain-containing protein n=1 Tax=Gracilimonas sp. TaxID=1974203 RepID=UPI0019912289|nr:trypsin-like peptidase domain-containing protein [Gracilimonas sp.]MBD3615626.1 trypsin-like peptidase domain-containing protein [Gracilimonas sp.]
MNRKDLILTGILLVMIGITAGTLIALYTINEELAPLSEVRTTEITRSGEPFISDEALEGADARFLFKKIAEEVTPTVVYIEAIVPIEGAIPNDENHEFEEEDEDGESIWDRLMPRRARTVGSGVLITSDGYILTNNHVIDGAVEKGLTVVLSDKREYRAKVVGFDSSTDLAVIKINGTNFPNATIGDSETLDVGEWVLAIGNPFRLRSTVTAGIVSALSRDVQIINDQMRIESFIQTDAAINKGNSGGALVNTSGQLIGINTAIASQTGAYQGYGFAVPSNLAIKVAEDLIEHGQVQRALLGVTIAGVDYDRAVEKGMETVRGVEILNVVQDGAASESGIRPGDVVLQVNGVEVNEANQLQQQVAVLRPGETVNLSILREGKIIQKNVALKLLERETIPEITSNEEPIIPDEIPEGNNEGAMYRDFELGFRVMALATPKDPEKFDLYVDRVYQGTEAWNRGLRADQQILKIEEEKVEDLTGLEELMHRNLNDKGSVMLEIINEDGARGFIQLKKK